MPAPQGGGGVVEGGGEGGGGGLAGGAVARRRERDLEALDLLAAPVLAQPHHQLPPQVRLPHAARQRRALLAHQQPRARTPLPLAPPRPVHRVLVCLGLHHALRHGGAELGARRTRHGVRAGDGDGAGGRRPARKQRVQLLVQGSLHTHPPPTRTRLASLPAPAQHCIDGWERSYQVVLAW
eukprot:6763-Rhodomonas_salina.1